MAISMFNTRTDRSHLALRTEKSNFTLHAISFQSLRLRYIIASIRNLDKITQDYHDQRDPSTNTNMTIFYRQTPTVTLLLPPRNQCSQLLKEPTSPVLYYIKTIKTKNSKPQLSGISCKQDLSTGDNKLV